ncbi:MULTISPECIES: ComEC/Rec2 family competence protein [Aphanothece]|uniref:ComEC/Rec2 family competence protein n=1 Tax=Aphanothece TaxID=1121 RepID=UPI0039856024
MEHVAARAPEPRGAAGPAGRLVWSRRLVWAGLLALILLRAFWLGIAPPPPVAGDPLERLAAAASAGSRDSRLEVTLRGTLLGDPQPTGPDGACRALLQLPAGRTELRFAHCPSLHQGWRLAVSGLLRRPEPAPHPLLAGPAERLQRQGATTQLQVARHEVRWSPATPIADLRRRMARQLVQRAGADRGGVLAALVLGSARVPLPAEVREAFRAAGLSHALAASGFHLSVLLGVVLPLGRRLPCLPRLGLAAGAMTLFVLLAGPQPSVLRAVLMGALALAVLESGQRGRPFGILMASALLLLLLRPDWLADVGFQLSVVATAALVLAATPLEQGLRGLLPGWCPGWLAAATAVPLAASLWTLPLQLFHFGVVPLYAVPANLVVAPLLTPLTLGAMAMAAVAALLPGLLAWLLPPLAWLCGVLLAVVQGFAALPMAQMQLGRPTPLLVLLLAGGLLGLSLPGLWGRLRWRGLALALVGAAVVGHLALLRADRLLLVHQGSRDLLVARHQGRAALVSLQADPFSCSRARQLATGLGVRRFDWVLLLDPVAPEQPACWGELGGVVLASEDGSLPLQPGQRLHSPGLSAEALSLDSRAIRLGVGGRPWLLLPDRQALWAWRDQPGAGRAEGIWLGFVPRRSEGHWLHATGVAPVWLSGNRSTQLPAAWHASGASGWLERGWG